MYQEREWDVVERRYNYKSWFCLWPAVFWLWENQQGMPPFWEHLLLHLYQDLPYILYSTMSQPVCHDTLKHSREGFWRPSKCIPIPVQLKAADLAWDKISRFIASGCQLPSLDMAPLCRQRANGASRRARVLVVQKSMSQCPKCVQ